jgi:serine/threonine protein kinase
MENQFHELKAGDIVENRYEILDIIGKGGFGVVYRAKQINIDRMVALKVLLPEAGNIDPQAVERFRREAVLISSLESPNTITLYEFGQTPQGVLFTVMEFARGETLQQLLTREGGLPSNRVIHIISQVLRSLHEAHQKGIIHRDLKPANIMVGEYAGQHDHAKVLDFGIAKILTASSDAQSTLILTGRLVGTPRYMAPEQLRGDNPTPACDLYALGLIMSELLTGNHAVSSTEPMEQIQAQINPVSFQLPHVVGVPPRLVTIVNRAMDKDVNKRFQSADVMRQALQGAAKISVMPEKDDEKTQLYDSQANPLPLSSPMAPPQPSFVPQYDNHPQAAPQIEGRGLGKYLAMSLVLFILALSGVLVVLFSDKQEPAQSNHALTEIHTQETETNENADHTSDVDSPDTENPAVVDTAGTVDNDGKGNQATNGETLDGQDPLLNQQQVDGLIDMGGDSPGDLSDVFVFETVAVEVTANTANARVYFGEDSCRTPCSIQVPVDGTPIQIRISKNGYHSTRHNVTAGDAPTLMIRLQERVDEDAFDIIL